MTEKDLFGNDIEPPKKYSSGVSVSKLSDKDREAQLETMSQWFYENYEDPVEYCPYDGREGGYQFVYGGPFEPRDVLQNEFGGIVADDVIEELASELESIASEGSGRSDAADIDDYAFESIVHSESPYTTLQENLNNIGFLTDVEVADPQADHFTRLLYLSVMIALETYLSDVFITKVCSDPALVRKFVETDKRFSKESIPVRESFKFTDSATERVKTHLLKFVWHRLSDVRRMFQETLGVTFPENIDDLDEAIRVRHDIVHRNGKKPDGEPRSLMVDDVKKAAQVVRDFVGELEEQINPGPF